MPGLSRARRAAPILALVLCVTGCSGQDGDPERSPAGPPSHVVVTLPPEPPGIRMSFLQQRIWEGTRRADVRVINITGATLSVRRIGLDWPGYPGRPQRFEAPVGPGQTLDLHYRLPAPDCSVDPSTPATGIAITGSRTIRRVVDDAGMRFLERIWGADCTRQRVDRMVAVSYDVPSPEVAADIPAGGGLDSRMPIHLRLDRRRTSSDTSAVLVDSVQGTVLFDLTLPRAGVGLDEAATEVAVPVVVDPGRCDEHARSQASQPFAFRVWLRIGDDPDLLSVLAVPDRAAQLRLLRFLDLACAGRTQH